MSGRLLGVGLSGVGVVAYKHDDDKNGEKEEVVVYETLGVIRVRVV